VKIHLLKFATYYVFESDSTLLIFSLDCYKMSWSLSPGLPWLASLYMCFLASLSSWSQMICLKKLPWSWCHLASLFSGFHLQSRFRTLH